MDHIEVADLDGIDLDYWFARAIGCTCMEFDDDSFVAIDQSNVPVLICSDQEGPYHVSLRHSWNEVGPIVEQVGYCLQPANEGGWCADGACTGYGPTPLVAVMRAHIAWKIGERVPRRRPNYFEQTMGKFVR